jgi:hypothetical protein
MPYTDPRRKQEWEQQHRVQRLARRRELHRIQRAQAQELGTEGGSGDNHAALVWAPMVIGGALASYEPKLAIGAGGLTLVAAAIGKKGAGWWIVGTLILIIGCVFYWSARKEDKSARFDGREG